MRKLQQGEQLKSTLLCCISCILPCGAFDVIRIVHSNGHVEEIIGTVRASDILKSHPKHLLKTPTTTATATSAAVIVVPPDAELRRGSIYFLIPTTSVGPTPPPKTEPPPSDKHRDRHDDKKMMIIRKDCLPQEPRSSSSSSSANSSLPSDPRSTAKKKQQSQRRRSGTVERGNESNKGVSGRANVVVSNDDQYLSEITSDLKVVSMGSRERRRGRVGVWRPHLESITET